jgi:hypothetical protein
MPSIMGKKGSGCTVAQRDKNIALFDLKMKLSSLFIQLFFFFCNINTQFPFIPNVKYVRISGQVKELYVQPVLPNK